MDSLRVRGLSFMEMEKNKAIERGTLLEEEVPDLNILRNVL